MWWIYVVVEHVEGEKRYHCNTISVNGESTQFPFLEQRGRPQIYDDVKEKTNKSENPHPLIYIEEAHTTVTRK